ncbi:hypothetical protein B0H10DRAFT_1966043 [Mycena sp. CBHHK59/15]|nr:hypothetical protein B0H10DRAFT_1966043 [Mycena sp. CBHHK59/15]
MPWWIEAASNGGSYLGQACEVMWAMHNFDYICLILLDICIFLQRYPMQSDVLLSELGMVHTVYLAPVCNQFVALQIAVAVPQAQLAQTVQADGHALIFSILLLRPACLFSVGMASSGRPLGATTVRKKRRASVYRPPRGRFEGGSFADKHASHIQLVGTLPNWRQPR